MLEDPKLVIALTEILAFARSGPTVEELTALFAARARTLLDAEGVDVRPLGRGGGSGPGKPGPAPEDRTCVIPVSCGQTAWGELRLHHRAGLTSADDLRRGRLLAEVLGAALVTVGRDDALPHLVDHDEGEVPADVARLRPDDLVALVMQCAEALDRMPDAPTRSRLALVAGRLAQAIGSPLWSVGLVHRGTLYDLSHCPAPGTGPARDHGATAPPARVRISRFPARRRASEGWAFHADLSSADAAERRVLAAGGHSAVIGAGGYDPDGRSWVVEVFTASDAGVEHVTPVLAALVQAALSFPRGAFVPHAEDPRVLTILGRRAAVDRPAEALGLGETGWPSTARSPGGSHPVRSPGGVDPLLCVEQADGDQLLDRVGGVVEEERELPALGG